MSIMAALSSQGKESTFLLEVITIKSKLHEDESSDSVLPSDSQLSPTKRRVSFKDVKMLGESFTRAPKRV